VTFYKKKVTYVSKIDVSVKKTKKIPKADLRWVLGFLVFFCRFLFIKFFILYLRVGSAHLQNAPTQRHRLHAKIRFTNNDLFKKIFLHFY
jgi:hypothetical protein